MNYNEIEGPNGLAEFLIEGLSAETKLKIFLDQKGKMVDAVSESSTPEDVLYDYISAHFYTAGWNILAAQVAAGRMTEEQFEEAVND